MTGFPFTLRQLEYAIAVRQTGGFRKAATRCHVSQPALSAQLAQMESALGVSLFERSRSGVLLTSAGAALLDRALHIQTLAQDLVLAAERFTDPLKGTIRLGIIPTIAPYLLAEVTPKLRNAFPELKVLWTEEKTPVIRSALETGTLEGALVALEADIGEVEHAKISKDPFVLAIAKTHVFAKGRSRLPVAKLKETRVHLLDDGHCFRNQALDLCTTVGLEEAAFRATSLTTLVQIVATSNAATLLPRLAVEQENRNQQLIIRPLSAPVPYRTLALVWRPSSPIKDALGQLAQVIRGAYPSGASR